MESAHAFIKSEAQEFITNLRVDEWNKRFAGNRFGDVLKSPDCDLTVSDVLYLLTGNPIYTPETRWGLCWSSRKSPGVFMTENKADSLIALATKHESAETLWRDLAA